MTIERHLIQKDYYETLLSEENLSNPIMALGEALLEEQKQEVYELSFIRFSQGEIYFHNKDFEAAIYKWENVNGELELWAKKNIGDAYYELGLLSIAEEMYTAIDSESSTLTAEVGLKLFSLYKEQQNSERSYEVIKNLVSFQPSYPNVTLLAREFYEEQSDWKSAVELAVDEAIRTESLKWFDTLKKYVDKGYTKSFAPDYFYQVLITFYKADQLHFKQLVCALWKSYVGQDSHLAWVKTINNIFLNVEVGLYEYWQEISRLYEETYVELINGQYTMRDLHDVVPHLLANWLKVTSQARSLFPSAAILAWNEQFTSSIASPALQEAERLIFESSSDIDGLTYFLELGENITKWGRHHGLEVGYKFNWLASSFADLKTKYVMVAGAMQSDKASIVNAVLNEHIAGGNNVPILVFHDEEFKVNQRSSKEMNTSTEWHSFSKLKEVSEADTCLEVRVPNRFLQDQHYGLIDIPGFHGQMDEAEYMFEYLPIADGLLFVLDANQPFTEKERDMLLLVKKQAPELPIHFVLNKVNALEDEREMERFIEETSAYIHADFPKASILPYASVYELDERGSIARFMKENFHFTSLQNNRERRISSLLTFIRKTLSDLLKQRAEQESGYVQAIHWNEDMLVRVNGFINTLEDKESEAVHELVNVYQGIKDQMKQALTKNLPKLLRECSSMLNEESDFRRIHLELNKKMNEKIQEYIEKDLLPEFRASLHDWMKQCNDHFTDMQSYIEDMGNSFNEMYEKERFMLQCDFKVLDDWKRDINRMTTRMQLEEENIFLRVNPAQILLKSAGKIFGSFSQNKTMLYNQYKKYIENEEYEDVTASVLNKFFLQFDLFEKSLEVDIHLFFEPPIQELHGAVEESHETIERSKNALNEMKESLTVYSDPLSVFQLRLRQYEIMLQAEESVTYEEIKSTSVDHSESYS